MPSTTYTIGRAARAAGVGVETVRFYERKGYIDRPPKPERGARGYPEATVDRIRALQQGQELGFTLDEVNALLALRADPAAGCGDVRERAEAHLEAVERKRARLDEVAEKLRELIAACPGHGATRECAILDAFTRPRTDDGDADDSETDAGGSPIDLHVDGMACGGCAATVRSLLRQIPGVRGATVDRVSGRARVRIDNSSTDGGTLASRLTDAGFPARPA